MRILYAGYSFDGARGGAEISAKMLMEGVSNGNEIKYVFASGKNSTEDHTVHVDISNLLNAPLPHHMKMLRIEKYFSCSVEKELSSFGAELAIFQEPAIPRIGRIRSLNTVFFIRSPDWYGLFDRSGNAVEFIRKLPNLPAAFARRTRNIKIMNAASAVFTNSSFMRDRLSDLFSVRTDFVYPPVPAPKPGREGRSSGIVGFMGMTKIKGGHIAARIARDMPGRTFIFLKGGVSSRALLSSASKIRNIVVKDWLTDMDGFYEKIGILIVPTIAEEPFGRCVVEAMAHGIPVITARSGGLEESNFSGGLFVDDVSNIAEWTDKIKHLDEPAVYAGLASAGRTHAERFSPERITGEFREKMKGLGIDI